MIIVCKIRHQVILGVVVLFVGIMPSVTGAQMASRSSLSSSSSSSSFAEIKSEKMRHVIESISSEKSYSSRDSIIASFWKELETDGSPIVERIDSDNSTKFYNVTFVWRGDSTYNPHMWWPIRDEGPKDTEFVHVPDTDIWYKTVTLPAGARISYQIVPNTLVVDGKAVRRKMLTDAKGDPLNKNRWMDSSRIKEGSYYSTVELPGATPQPYVRTDSSVFVGQLTTHNYKSKAWKNTRRITVYAPHGYESAKSDSRMNRDDSVDVKKYPVLVLFDEDFYIYRAGIKTIMDNMIAARVIPPMIVVLIANPSAASRAAELTCNPDFTEGLAKEFMPWVRDNYPITDDPDKTLIGGASYGGLAGAYAALKYPAVFGKVLSQSGSFWWSPTRNIHTPELYNEFSESEWLIKEYVKSPKKPIEFYLDAGIFEISLTNDGGGILDTNRHMRDVLQAKGYKVTHKEFIGGHDFFSWRGTLSDGLIVLLGVDSGLK